MADLATEIEQMQNAFDDEVDVLEQNGGIGHDDEERNGRNSSSDDRRKRNRSGGDEELEEGEEADDDIDDNRNRRKMVKSSIIDTSGTRKASISKDEINQAQLGGKTGKKRASRLFANLLGTLRTFDEKVKTENGAEKRAEIDKKVDERIATDRRKILEEKRALMQKRQKKEKYLGLLEEKHGYKQQCANWEENAMNRIGYIFTEQEPKILWKPKTNHKKTDELIEKTEKIILEKLKESKEGWEEYEKKLDEEIEEIKEQNDFKESELNIREVNGRTKFLDNNDARNMIKRNSITDHNGKEQNQRKLLITKTVVNDTRRVKPRENSEEKEEKEKKSKKERRKQIEENRKRRHHTTSESSENEYVERPKSAVKIVKDVRRVAAKESDDEKVTRPVKQPEPIVETSRRRITVKTQKSDLDSSRSEKERPKRRRVAKRSDTEENEKKSTKKSKKSARKASSSSSSSEESEPEQRPRRSSRRK